MTINRHTMGEAKLLYADSKEIVPAHEYDPLAAALREVLSDDARYPSGWASIEKARALLGLTKETGAKPVERTNVCKHYATIENCPLCSPKSEGGKDG